MAVPVLGNVQHATQSGASDNVIVNVPTGLSNDDAIIFIVCTRVSNPDGRTFNTPAGVTEIADYRDNGADAAVYIGSRIVDGSEASTYEFDWNGDRASIHAWAIAISGNHDTTVLDVLGAEFADATGTSHAITGVTTTVDDCLVFYALSADGGNMSPFSVDGSWVEQADETIGSASTGSAATWGTLDQETAGATGNATVTSDASDGTIGVIFSIAPAAGGGGGGALILPSLLQRIQMRHMLNR